MGARSKTGGAWCAAVLSILVLSAAAPASADEDAASFPVRARVRVDASAGCASAETFWSSVARHTARVLPAADGDADPAAVTMTIEPEGSERVVGTLRVTLSGRAPWQRRLTGATCAEVTDGLALVTALAFDPAASDGPRPPVPPAPAPVPEPAATAIASAPTPSPAPAPPSDASDVTRDRAPSTPSREDGGGWGGALLGAIGPLGLGASRVTVGYAAYGELAREHAGIAPSLRLGLTHAEGSAYVGPAGRGTDLAWTTARASICPLRADLATGLSLRPCAGAELGVLRATPHGLDTEQPSSRLWATATVSGRVRWLLGSAFFMEGELALAVPLLRDQFAADPGIDLYQAPVVIPLASLAAGVRFP